MKLNRLLLALSAASLFGCVSVPAWNDKDKKWEARVKYASSNGGFFKASQHYVRPLPQTFLDNITKEDGTPLTADEKAAMQNPGY